MADKNNVTEILDTLFHGMDGFVNSKTVVGEPVKVGDATLIPLIEVSCGMGAGGFSKPKDSNKDDGGAGALSSRITPTAILILQNGNSKLINVKNQDAFTKILDMIPDAIDKFTGGSRVSKDAEKAALDIIENEV
ncbi:GerW family sporulation protein [Oribacterium sp. P6A1]|uniref:GerW family sporulation protein n=1 Tax=Oribacterium sp. P6A1 TaxID=1410612 RepID=UPI000560D74F|nr:GerW family sporulation protein [Oribacterium sp. P6A1]